jgi:hypothetical protein
MAAAVPGIQAFRECGWPALVVVLFALLGAVLGLTALGLAVAKTELARAVAVLALGVALAAPGMGAVGTFVGRLVVNRALEGEVLDPSHIDRIRVAGYAEAEQCTTLGLVVGALPLVVAVAGVLVAFLRRRKPEPHA